MSLAKPIVEMNVRELKIALAHLQQINKQTPTPGREILILMVEEQLEKAS